jgi:hypothetical protein
MPFTQITANAALNAQETMLIQLADQYCEQGNHQVIGANQWVRPIIKDFITMVKERYQAIQKYAEQNRSIDHEVLRAADLFLDEVIELVVSAYPLAASYNVRSITSKIRNGLAIARLDVKAGIDKKNSSSTETSVTTGLEGLRNEKITCKKFREFCKHHPDESDAISGIVFTTSIFHNIALQCASRRENINSGITMRLSDLSERKYLSDKTSSIAAEKIARETYFDAFRRYWKSFQHSNIFLALAIKKMLADEVLLKRIIRYRVDVKELLLYCSPTIDMRKQVLSGVLLNHNLSLKMVAELFEGLPEGSNINWRVDRAAFGIKRYQITSRNKNPEAWEGSRKKIRSEVYEWLCEQYRYSSALERKIIIYALLESDGKKMQRLVCQAMGYSRVDITRKIFHSSIRQDAAEIKVDIHELEAQVIQTLIATVNAGNTIESGAYNPIMGKLKQLIPSLYAVNSSFE